VDTRELFLKELKTKGEAEDIPNISLVNALFLRKLLRDTSGKNMLEIGTANGYSTIHFADELEKIGGHITTIEFSENSYHKAMENFKEV
jgi:predicted O-methyltransferase YrrM